MKVLNTPKTLQAVNEECVSNMSLFDTMPKFKFYPNAIEINRTFSTNVYHEIIMSPSFQRLSRIRFLGAIDFLIHPNGAPTHRRHTRYHHTLGVAELAIYCCRWLNVSDVEEKHTVIAALLHDIGHAPLSHSLEPVFKKSFGIGHHEAGRRILMGKAPIGADIHHILRSNGIDIERVLSLIEGKSNEKTAHLFSGPINIDTVEAISRSYSYASSNSIGPAPFYIIKSAVLRADNGDQRVLDDFWRLKGKVYQHIINGKAGILADAISQHYMKKNLVKFGVESYYMNETELRKFCPDIFRALELSQRPALLRRQLLNEVDEEIGLIEVQDRKFYVDDTVHSFSPDADRLRYRQTKKLRTLHISELMPSVTAADGEWIQTSFEMDDELSTQEH
ncbi:HD domain-containing protein [Azospirillum sp. Marseille-Q6669]